MKKFFNKTIIGFIISVIFIILILRTVNIKESIEAIKNLNMFYVVLMVPVYLCSFLFRAFRWKTILSENKKIRFNSLLNSLFRGWLANCIIPARGGEFYRAHYFGKKEDISRITVMASIVLERMFDGMILFLILLFLISFIYSNPHLGKVAIAAGIVFMGGFISLLITAKLYKNEPFKEKFCAIAAPIINRDFFSKIFNKISYFITSFMNGLEIFHSPALLFKSFLYTAGIWFCEAVAILLLIIGFGHFIGIYGALFVISVVAFASLIPAGSAGIGPVQWGYIIALGVFGISKETAFAVSITGLFFTVIFIFAASLASGAITMFLEKQENKTGAVRSHDTNEVVQPCLCPINEND